jgi:hypothetical protein
MATMHMDATEYQALMKVQEQLELRIKENAEKDKVIQDLKDAELLRMKNCEKMVVKKTLKTIHKYVTEIDINEYTIRNIIDRVSGNHTLDKNNLIGLISQQISAHIKENSRYSSFETRSTDTEEEFEYVNLTDIEDLMYEKAKDNLDRKLKVLMDRESKINEDYKLLSDKESYIKQLENKITKKEKEYESHLESNQKAFDNLMDENTKFRKDISLNSEKVNRIISERDKTFKEVSELVGNLGLFNYTTVKIMVQQKLK